jgi:hypothetical protein
MGDRLNQAEMLKRETEESLLELTKFLKSRTTIETTFSGVSFDLKEIQKQLQNSKFIISEILA